MRGLKSSTWINRPSPLWFMPIPPNRIESAVRAFLAFRRDRAMSAACPVVWGPAKPVLLTSLLYSGHRYPDVIGNGMPKDSRVSSNFSMNAWSISCLPQQEHSNSSGLKCLMLSQKLNYPATCAEFLEASYCCLWPALPRFSRFH